jgi:uncharacterized protein (TIGR00730 family)
MWNLLHLPYANFFHGMQEGKLNVKYICVFCGSSMGLRPAYKLAAQAMGETLARRGLGLVYGGGNVGLMGIVADAALAAGGQVIGVIPEFLVAKEIAHTGLTKIRCLCRAPRWIWNP